jgi:hypothetical protein
LYDQFGIVFPGAFSFPVTLGTVPIAIDVPLSVAQ